MTRVRIHLWYDVAWPVLAGLVTGAGLIAAYRWTGPTKFVVALAVLELTLAPVTWSLLTELGIVGRRVALRVAPLSPVALLAVIGSAAAIGAWTYLVLGLVVAGSPLLRGWGPGGLRRIVKEWSAADVRTRQEFDEIVAHGFGTPDDEPPR